MDKAKIKITDIAKRYRQGERLTMLTAYDATVARLVDEAGIDMILVGDSLGMVVQGHDSTIPVTLDEVIYHTRCAARGAARALVVADLPFMSYQASATQALLAAGRAMKEGTAGASTAGLTRFPSLAYGTPFWPASVRA